MKQIRTAVLVLLVLVVATGAWATERLVPSQYSTIQAAINACVNGDIVTIDAGTYNESITVAKDITVRSDPTDANRLANTIIDGSSGASVTFNSGADGAYFSYLTVTGGSPGISVNSCVPTITRCAVTGNSNSGVRFDGSTATQPLLSWTVISNNTAAFGGGVNVTNGADPLVDQCTIEDNFANSMGGAISVVNSAGKIQNCLITSNVAVSNGGGVYINSSTTSRFYRTVVAGNSAGQAGDGIYVSGGAHQIINNTFDNNTGYGIYFSGTATAYIKNNSVTNNTYGICANSNASIRYNNVWGNTTNYSGISDQTGTNGNISSDPLYGNAAALDYHEKSTGGRYVIATGSWTTDAVHSPNIDAGDPALTYANEPEDNGDVINIGAFGNTSTASKASSGGRSPASLVASAAALQTSAGAQITLSLSQAADIEIVISNLAGRTVAVLPITPSPQGMSTVLWNGKSSAGTRVPAGRYFAQVTARTKSAAARTMATLQIK